MNTRPIATAEENKKLVHAWAHQMRRELPPTHPAQETLTAVIRHNYVPSFKVSKPLEAVKDAADNDTRAIVWFFFGAFALVCFGRLGFEHPLCALALFIAGLVSQGIAFALAQPEDAS